MQLETSRISEQQFDEQEKILLDRLDRLEAGPEPEADDGEPEDTPAGEPAGKHARDT
jgi:hypothetical protein